MVLYLDLIFLSNFLIDGAILLTTAWTRKVHVKVWRIVISASIGACYAVLMLFPYLSFMFTFLVKCLFSLLMIMTAFGFGGLQNFLRNLGVFYVINFVAAGGIFGVYYFLQSSSDVMNGILFTRSGGLQFQIKIGLLFIVIIFLLVLWLYKMVFLSTKRREEMTGFMAEVRIHIDDKEFCCMGLIDTGNQLYDPLTRTPVMVMEAAQWEEILPESWMKRIKQAEVDQILAAIGTDEFIWQDRLRLVPYRGVNRGTQFMLAIKPDKVVIIHNEKKVEAHKVLVALDGGKLCSDGSYQAIIHPMLINIHAS